MDEQHSDNQNTIRSFKKCVRQLRTSINIDCVKVCPMDKQLWAFSFYQQHPEFVGGVQVLTTPALQSKLGNQNGYLQIGPIMHIQWLDITSINKSKDLSKNKTKKYYILAAHRCNKAIILSYTPIQSKLHLQNIIQLQQDIFCLYCDWKLLPNKQTKFNYLQCIAIISSNQSSVFCFTISIHQSNIKIISKIQFNKHSYAIWACKLQPSVNYLVVGDQVNCLYLYNINTNDLVAKNTKAHDQGICQIVWKDNQKILSGSFDGTIAEISIQNFESVLRRFNIGGTIWRIIPIVMDQQNQQETYLICNSSEKEFQIYNLKLSKIIWKSYSQHTSLAYAADYNDKFIVTVSFYDQAVSIWK